MIISISLLLLLAHPLFSAAGQPSGSPLSTWTLLNGSHPCTTTTTLSGVICRHGNVVSITLVDLHLTGEIPPSLFNISSLRHLNLRSNSLQGLLPNTLFSSLNLVTLILSHNSLSGPIPSSIRTLTHLQTLHLSHNYFTGALPPSFSPSLTSLNLSFNHFTGPIPVHLFNLTNLQSTLDLSHNLLSGPVPETLGDLPDHVYIDLASNNLSGQIPPTIGLLMRGPTAFQDNPLLCGLPLDTPCTPLLAVSRGGNSTRSTSRRRRHYRRPFKLRWAVVAVGVTVVMVSVCVSVGLVVVWVRGSQRRRCVCFTEEGREQELVAVDVKVMYDLEELLRAPALILGRGAKGLLYKVKMGSGEVVAVRRLGEGGSQKMKEFQSEMEAIAKVRHPNILSLKAYCWSPEEKLVVSDYIHGGNLAAAIHGNYGGGGVTPLLWETRVRILKGVAEGLSHIHEVGNKMYIHGDVKPTNILLSNNMDPLISDFGFGRPVEETASTWMSSPGGLASPVSPSVRSLKCYYQAPEALRGGGKASQKWDVFAFGVVLVEVVTGRPPGSISVNSGMEMARWVQQCIDQKKPLAQVLDPSLLEEMEKEGEEMAAVLMVGLACAAERPERRPPMREVSGSLNRIVS